MLRRTLVILLVIAITGCTVRKSAQVVPPDLPVPGQERITGITTVKGEMFTFDAQGAFMVGDVLRAEIQNAPFEIPLDQIQRYWVERKEVSTGRTIALVTVTAAAVGLIAWAIATHKEEPKPANTSCPFVYAWDGSSYILDGEPYGGAITKGLERDDYSELVHLRADGRSYRILVTNESDETQFTNLMALQVVDHPANMRVVADADGAYHTVDALQAPISAEDQSGHDLLRWLDANDRLIWEPPAAMDSDGSVRTPINLAFPKPNGAKTVDLVANVATGT